MSVSIARSCEWYQNNKLCWYPFFRVPRLTAKCWLVDRESSLAWDTFTFMNLADAFIQSDLQSIQAIHLLSVCVFPVNWTHNLLHCKCSALPLSHRNSVTRTTTTQGEWSVSFTHSVNVRACRVCLHQSKDKKYNSVFFYLIFSHI